MHADMGHGTSVTWACCCLDCVKLMLQSCPTTTCLRHCLWCTTQLSMLHAHSPIHPGHNHLLTETDYTKKIRNRGSAVHHPTACRYRARGNHLETTMSCKSSKNCLRQPPSWYAQPQAHGTLQAIAAVRPAWHARPRPALTSGAVCTAAAAAAGASADAAPPAAASACCCCSCCRC